MINPTREEIAELINLWHLSRVPVSGKYLSRGEERYKRLLWTSGEFSKAHPERTSLWAYKVLERQLAGVYAGNPQGPASRFRHETVRSAAALRRSGREKIRTVTTPSGHRVRIAFPPGRRRRGSGRVQGILHPAGENPLYPKPRAGAPDNAYRIAFAAATDAGNRSAKAAGRSKWSRADFAAAAETLERILGKPEQSNPKRTKIYQHCIKIYASKEGMPHNCDDACKKAGHRYVHKFEHQNICIYGLGPDKLLIEEG